MTGSFNAPTPNKCAHYARFMKHLTRAEADTTFYSLFVTMIVLLIIAAQMYTKATHTSALPAPLQHRLRLHCLLISLLTLPLAALCCVLEAFAALSIEFCDGEDLMIFYWSFWTLIQVGSLIAILGISVSQGYCLVGKEGPPWNVALGTPVLVLAAFGHVGGLGWRVGRRWVRGLSGRGEKGEAEGERKGSEDLSEDSEKERLQCETLVSTC